MKNNKHKILVLSDLKSSDSTMLKNTVSLAKIIDADIDFLCIKKPTEVVKKENQLSAMRTINQEHFSTKKQIKSLLNPINKAYNTNINHTLRYGNVKDEIANYIESYQPDIVVLGKRKSKLLSVMGDNILKHVLKQHKGNIMISGEENVLEPNNELTLGLFNDANDSFHFADNLIKHTQKPLKAFKIVKNPDNVTSTNIDDKKTIEYVFEENDNVFKNLSNYLLKNNVNLLCINRKSKKLKKTNKNIKNVINNLNVSLFLTTEQNLKYQ